MRYAALATDYDGTLAEGGVVCDEAWQALERLRASGRKLILVTGRDINDVRSICPSLDHFDRVVAENGGVVYRPATGEEVLLAPPPPPELVEALRDRGVAHLGVSSTILATVKPNEVPALEAIRDLGLELQVQFNKDAVMIVSPGITKATGLAAALDELHLSPHNVVGIGDAENDHAFLRECECSAAVANALPMVRKHADFVTAGESSRGVMELIEELIADDLQRRLPFLGRHQLLLGRRSGATPNEEVRFSPYGTVALVAGASGGGKSTVTLGLLERLASAGYQFCVFDPEGDYEEFEQAVTLGDAHHSPLPEEVLTLLRQPKQNIVINMLRVPLAERPLFAAGLLTRMQQLRAETGRPHWIVVDEAHHIFPAEWDSAKVALPQQLETALLITVHPQQLTPVVLEHVNVVLAVGDSANETLQEFAEVVKRPAPAEPLPPLVRGQTAVWQLGAPLSAPFIVTAEPSRTERRRHVRKYAEGLLIPERSFYFRGPEGKLNLRAHNLLLFMELGEGVDDATWVYHLHRGDYSRWFSDVIGDEELAHDVRAIESQPDVTAKESRKRVRNAIEQRYTLPENPSLPKIGSGAGT